MKHLFWIVPLALIVLIGLWVWGFYNSVVTLNENADTQWAQVETEYQRRLDLIPGLVNSVKGSMAQEQAVFGAIADARTKYAGAKTADAKAGAATEVEGALSRLLVVMENYPQLASTNTVRDLMVQLEGTENRVSVQRLRYNDVIRDYNLKVKYFPGSLIAGMFGFEPKSFFEAAAGAEKAPVVDLNVAPVVPTPNVVPAPAQ